MYPAHASLPVLDLVLAMRCPVCFRVDPRCGQSVKSGSMEFVSCSLVGDGFMISQARWR
jgi:hypothetical protein